MKYGRRSLSCLLLACLLAGLAGCGVARQETTIQTEASAFAESVPVTSEPGDTLSDPQQAQPVQTRPGEPDSAPPTESTTPQPSQTEQAKPAVSLLVSCQTALDKGYREQPNLRDAIPADGVLFSSDSVVFEEGESAMSLLKRVMEEQGIVVSVKRTYVRGIGGLFERTCGPSSGWLYRVNGEFPTVSCADYRLQEGDQVAFLYTCEQGDITA